MTGLCPQRAPFVWQLSSPERRIGRPAAGRVRATGLPADGPAGASATPGVILISRAGDAGLTEVARILGKLGLGSLRIDAEALSGVPVLADPVSGTLQVGSVLVRPTVTWIRHFSDRVISAELPAPMATFQRDSWSALVSQIHQIGAVAVPSRQPGLLDQLALASRLGVAVPRTVVTTDVTAVTGLIRSPRVVVKALGSHFAESATGELTGVFPEIVARGRLAGAAGTPGVPVVAQEFIEHDTELRVYYVQGDVWAFEITKDSPAALWADPASVLATAVDPPAAVRAAATAMASALHLRYGAFDFLMQRSLPVFLEVNVTGDWTWVEQRAGTTDVTTAVAHMLMNLHLGAGAPRTPMGLLRFLS